LKRLRFQLGFDLFWYLPILFRNLHTFYECIFWIHEVISCWSHHLLFVANQQTNIRNWNFQTSSSDQTLDNWYVAKVNYRRWRKKLHGKSYLRWYEREKRFVFCFLWTILNLIHLVSPSSFTHNQLCKTPLHFFLCIFWSFNRLKKCCSLTSKWCCNNNNLHNLIGILQLLITTSIGWKVPTDLSLFIILIIATLSFYNVTITMMPYVREGSISRPFQIFILPLTYQPWGNLKSERIY
jgi:hypothetical protein